ncbi:hypothetical protein DDB_G0286843 [Dictyostelium discoideum AX4]|uniref:GATA zinc finger domain-containing protein 17 n=1 Tax=Dictyostelium discoideum TaxID=44689 RepID=GTAQ_DICDI|nr:hypothetical protein DDB_G0286843 [Dictyostelium discoideum AX4]Q54L80.1 RecName: Full=GATA zinc finger domain-containing protein 17 [Dictyostelium discoideum]EAL64019.1 hypothetical protein DDB_G0286843 [Dictyostelium discoideum AX4]|eukprot:XP_637523.1 hypothetical protein DDB_G0286843 [Dictyostelium discoideum AX4]
MGKRKTMQSFNLESFGKNLEKKLRRNPEQLQQPIKNYKSERERDIHELIYTIKSERMFIYKNAHRHLKLALENATLALNLPMLLKDFHVTLKEFDALEASLNAELECLELQYSSDTSELLLPVNSVNTSQNTINENAITTAIASLSVNPVNTSVALSTASTSTSTPTNTTTTTTTTSNSLTKNNNSALVSKPKTRGVRSKPIDMNSSDDEEDDQKDDQDKDDSDEDNVDNTPPLDSNDSKPPSSKTKGISKTKTKGNVSTAITTTTTPITTTDSNIIGTTTTTDDITEESKVKERPPRIFPENCYVCKVTETPYWRRGTDNGVVVDLCNECGLYYMNKEKKERLSRQKHSIKNVLN